ncbi:hypothetical protein N7522_011450 [Penicillium canescens]|uniref:ABM domain-containing protein n=1 Tax=Penicillium canescens TaxID=5083 RepID=A0AAD6IL24_PENCN|nr:uncharacterized protein N7446_007173 [Penicillium canescens]KAJ5991243.1 hypothetical protein N7522_011450 [Penicillium canescens]KAJ6049498.1 hypothetical protein N7444_006214 [Penicillium canescens]KAJ6052533.1 hypothetical protein N7460_003067 [Penicillium canescens]KAJ6063053.1 hypothetical protein N7446_007173 [Penicillium canescens]
MSQSICQFIFFRVKPSVKPEDPSNEEGYALMEVLRATKHQNGHQSSSWGRTVEDTNTIVWVVDWTDARCSTDTDLLAPFLDPSNTQTPASIYVTLIPPVRCTATLTMNPVTELCALPFASELSVSETKQLNTDLINFRRALVDQLPQQAGPKSWAMGHVDRPSKLPHAKSPDGKAVVYFLAVGWDSVDAHVRAKETENFAEAIRPIREKMLPPIPGLEMKHVSFQMV